MNRLRRWWQQPIGKVVFVGGGVLLVFIVMVLLFSPAQNTAAIAKQMQDSVNATTASVTLHRQLTLQTVAGKLYQEKQREQRDIENSRQQLTAALAKQAATNAATLKKVADEMAALQKALKAKTKTTVPSLKPPPQKPNVKADTFVVGGALNPNAVSRTHQRAITVVAPSHYYVVDDMSARGSITPATHNNDDILHQEPEAKKSATPMYTIPANTLLTGVVPEQPLVGVIPTDNTVRDPETVQFMLGRKNFAANGWRLPDAIHGIQGNATCTGVFNFSHSAVKCSITSLTFIFKDGTIATETSDTEKGDNSKSFGVLTDSYGNPYIQGFYHGNAALAGAGTGVFAGIQGWGNAIAAGEQQTSSNNLQLVQTIKNANKYAMGSALGQAGQAWNNWWLSIVKSTTNYVFVPNWNKKTHKLLQLNAKILNPVAIDYDSAARKVEYRDAENSDNNSLD